MFEKIVREKLKKKSKALSGNKNANSWDFPYLVYHCSIFKAFSLAQNEIFYNPYIFPLLWCMVDQQNS